MHQISIPQSVVDRVVQRRGKEHVFEDLDPARTALVVVDLQNGFMMPGVAFAMCDTAREIVPNVNRIAASVRATGGTVVWIRTTYTEQSLVSWSVMHDMLGPVRNKVRSDTMREGAKGNELWPDLDVRPGDLTVRKQHYSAFIQGSSDLEATLRARGIDTVIVTGTVTNTCCESTARDAMMRNFKVIMVTDANAGANDEEHNASLIAFYLNFGDIMSTDFLVSRLERDIARPAVAAE